MYIYNDEDNAPMNDEFIGFHNPTVYSSRAEMLAVESGAYEEKEEHENGCWNCMDYCPNRYACTLNWNNLDESYYNPDTDDHDPDYICENWNHDPDAVYEDFFVED